VLAHTTASNGADRTSSAEMYLPGIMRRVAARSQFCAHRDIRAPEREGTW